MTERLRKSGCSLWATQTPPVMVHRDAHPVPLVQKDSNRETYRNIHIHTQPMQQYRNTHEQTPFTSQRTQTFLYLWRHSRGCSHTPPRRATMATEQPSPHTKGRAPCGKPHTEDSPGRGQKSCSLNGITEALKQRNLKSLEHWKDTHNLVELRTNFTALQSYTLGKCPRLPLTKGTLDLWKTIKHLQVVMMLAHTQLHILCG